MLKSVRKPPTANYPTHITVMFFIKDQASSPTRVREKLARPHGEEQETGLGEEAAVMVPRVPAPRVLALLVVHRGGHFCSPCLSQTRAPRWRSACGRLPFLLLLSLQGWQRLPPSIASRTRLQQHSPVTALALASRQQRARSPPRLLAQRARGKEQRLATRLRLLRVCSTLNHWCTCPGNTRQCMAACTQASVSARILPLYA